MNSKLLRLALMGFGTLAVVALSVFAAGGMGGSSAAVGDELAQVIRLPVPPVSAVRG